ncbi:MAG TPA: carboxypeptidase M32 [Gemmataceae bacterium]|nr:carboxypeptidase M32 [Gemmataceae bacterium]
MRDEIAYADLIRRTREQSLLASCAELLAWDEDTYMPPSGAEHRAAQLALLAGLQHARATDPRLGDLLAAVEGSPLVADPDSAEAVNVREIRRGFDRQTRLPRGLVEELARSASLAERAWAEARRAADFRRFRPWLEKIVRLKQREAESLALTPDPYDALLDGYEPGARGDDLVGLFDALRRELVPLVNAIVYGRRRPDTAFLRRPYPVQRQRAFGEAVAAAVGFDFRRGRLDTTTHPFFSAVGPGDCRLTTRFAEDNFSDGLFGILHEVGHGLYEQGLPAEDHGTPLGEVSSLALHESQARLWENAVGHSRPFWQYFFPAARAAFPGALVDVALDEFHFAVNAVEPSLIRVGADEVTYNLHIVIRFELERALLGGDLSAADLPAAWDEAYRHHLGVVPRDDAEGCLQDGHWAAGMFGYFPTYTLGNVLAAQLVARARQELGDLDGGFARGDFGELLGWLREKVYREGGRYSARRLIERVTASPPDHQPLIDELRRKYGELYDI